MREIVKVEKGNTHKTEIDGLYVLSNADTETRARLIDNLSDKLGLGLTVEKVE